MLSMTFKPLRLYATALLVLLVPAAGIASAQSQAAVTKKAEVSVSGMACQQACAPTLHKRLTQLPDVKAVTVSAELANAVITFAASSKVTDKAIKEAVTEAGFTAIKIVWQESSKQWSFREWRGQFGPAARATRRVSGLLAGLAPRTAVT